MLVSARVSPIPHTESSGRQPGSSFTRDVNAHVETHFAEVAILCQGEAAERQNAVQFSSFCFEVIPAADVT